MLDNDLTGLVKKKYGEAALRVMSGAKGSCCGDDDCGAGTDPVCCDLYSASEEAAVPEAAVRGSLGCGNPTALAELQPGETVLDLGSGGGIDVLLAAAKVGPHGAAFGLDMTDEMLELAERNRAQAKAENAKFLKGRIEAIPLPSSHVDVVISNCVINLSTDKAQVLKEAFRVLKPGGRLAVSDVVTQGDLSEQMRQNAMLYVGCVAGALNVDDYKAKLKQAGFEQISIEPQRQYDVPAADEQSQGRVFSAFIRAKKPR